MAAWSFQHLRRRLGFTKLGAAAARMYLERNAIARFKQGVHKASGRILCYHSIGQPQFGVNDVPPSLFRRQIEAALRAGYRFVPASQIALDGGHPKDLSITFDDAFCSVKTQAAPILKEYGIPWSVFVVSEWSEHKEDWFREHVLGWKDLGELLNSGAEIGSHSMTHPDFGVLGSEAALQELEGSRRTIESRLGAPIVSFAIPLGQSMNWSEAAQRAAAEVGYTNIYAQAEQTRPAHTIARTFVTKFDDETVFSAALGGAFDNWEEWVWN